MTFGFSETSGQRQVPQRWKDLEFYASDSWKLSPRITFDYGVRYSAFYNPYAADDKIMSFDPASFNASLGSDPCNGLLQAPGPNWCQAAGLLGGTTGPNRSLFPQDLNNFAPRLGLAWDINGDGKSAVARRARPVLPARAPESGSERRRQPAVRHRRQRQPHRSTRNSPNCDGCSFGNSLGAPSAGSEQSSRTPQQLAVEPLLPA